MMIFSLNTKIRNSIYYLSGLILILAIWHLLSFIFSPSIVPYPYSVFMKMMKMLSETGIYFHLFSTVSRTLAGFFLAFILGTVIGILTGSLKPFEKSLFIPVALLQGAPPMLWVIPLMLIVGTGGMSPVAVVFLVCLPLVIINIQEGRKTIIKPMFDMFKIYADSRTMKFRELIIPSLAPYLKSILFLGLILAMKSSIIGEWFGAKNGIGRMINEYFYSFDMVSFYATSAIFLMAVGVLAVISKKAGEMLLPANKKSAIDGYTPGIPEGYFNASRSCLKMEDVVFSYGTKKILSIGNFSICPGDVIVLTGDSGCGKTTLARLVTGILKPQSGRIALPSRPGYIFQEDVLLKHLDCFGNASLPAKCKNIQGYESIVLYFLEKCGLSDCINMFPDELSGGMKKRLTFARALILNPDFMVLDEPFNNLHMEARKNLWDLYFELFAGRNIPSLIITHYPEELAGRNIKLYEMKNRSLIEI
jgi:ABC-type nitrate/sulfonate/bicarbonate transport system ATPase subunit/ABC-type nitrate/sulfonate/bicarbonate transport system permease component